jgi:hypothetical protein
MYICKTHEESRDMDLEMFRLTGAPPPPIPRRPRTVPKPGRPKKFALVRIDTDVIRQAVEANPNALAVLLLIAGRARGLATAGGWVTVPTAARTEIGLGRTRYSRSLADMEAAGLIEVQRTLGTENKPSGRAARVRLRVDLGLPGYQGLV